MSEPTQDDFDCIKSVALSSMETAEALMDECVKRADKIKELEAQVYSLTEQRDRFARVNTRLMRKADEQYYTLCEHVAYTHLIESERDSTIRYLTKEHNNHIEELETRCDNLNKACERREISILKESDKLNTKNILLGNMLLQNELEIGRMQQKIFDIEEREDLVTTELERRASVADWEAKCRDVARLRTVIRELESDTVCLKSAVNVFRALVDNKDLRIADLESQRGMVRKTHDAREEELLGIVNGLTSENHGLQFTMDNWKASHYYDDATSLEMLDCILEIVNPLIKSGMYARKEAEKLLASQMYKLCQTVVQFRRKHNIVG